MSLHLPVSGMSVSPSEMRRYPTHACTKKEPQKQLDDGLVKPNEILTKLAPPMGNTCSNQIERVLDTSILSKKSKKTKEPKSRERECDENQ